MIRRGHANFRLAVDRVPTRLYRSAGVGPFPEGGGLIAALFVTIAVILVRQGCFGPGRPSAARADVINRFEQEREPRVIALIHRLETVSGFGGLDALPQLPGLLP